MFLDQGVDDASFAALAVEGTRPDLRAELAELDRILKKLPLEQRMTWLLHRVEGWSIRETAGALDCSTATVKRRLSAADSAVGASDIILDFTSGIDKIDLAEVAPNMTFETGGFSGSGASFLSTSRS